MTFGNRHRSHAHGATRGIAPAGRVAGRAVVFLITYTAPLADVDALLPAHRRFLDEHIATGEFLASGPRDPRTGGVIVGWVADTARAAELIAADPFTQHGLATYEVHEFHPTRGPLSPLLQGTAAGSRTT